MRTFSSFVRRNLRQANRFVRKFQRTVRNGGTLRQRNAHGTEHATVAPDHASTIGSPYGRSLSVSKDGCPSLSGPAWDAHFEVLRERALRREKDGVCSTQNGTLEMRSGRQ